MIVQGTEECLTAGLDGGGVGGGGGKTGGGEERPLDEDEADEDDGGGESLCVGGVGDDVDGGDVMDGAGGFG